MNQEVQKKNKKLNKSVNYKKRQTCSYICQNKRFLQKEEEKYILKNNKDKICQICRKNKSKFNMKIYMSLTNHLNNKFSQTYNSWNKKMM